MANAQDAIDKLDAWFALQNAQTIQDYIKPHDGSFNKSQIARDAGFGRKALGCPVNGNKRLQKRFEKIVLEIEEKKWTQTKSKPASTSSEGKDQTTIALEKKLTEAYKMAKKGRGECSRLCGNL